MRLTFLILIFTIISCNRDSIDLNYSGLAKSIDVLLKKSVLVPPPPPYDISLDSDRSNIFNIFYINHYNLNKKDENYLREVLFSLDNSTQRKAVQEAEFDFIKLISSSNLDLRIQGNDEIGLLKSKESVLVSFSCMITSDNYLVFKMVSSYGKISEFRIVGLSLNENYDVVYNEISDIR